METKPWFKVSSERPENRGINLAIPGLVVWHVIHYTIAAPINMNVITRSQGHSLTFDPGLS